MRRFLKPPDFGTDELNIAARGNYYLAMGFIVMSLIFPIFTLLIAPELVHRSLVIGATIIPVSILSMVLVRKGKTRVAGAIMIMAIWVFLTLGTASAGGIAAPMVIGYLVIIIFSSLIVNRKANIIIGIICILTSLWIALAESKGLLPTPINYSPIARVSIYTFFFILVLLLQNINFLNTRVPLKQSQSNEARYRSLLENIPVTTYIDNTAPEAKTEYVSPQVEKLLGYPRNVFTDDPLFWVKILHPDDAARVLERSRDTSRTKEPFDMEYRVIAKDKRVVWLKDEATLVHDEEGRPLYWLGVWTDVTQLKQAENEQADLVNGMTRRTIQLQTAAEVSRAATSILDINELLPNVVELIRNHFEYYYVGIFLVDEEKEWAILSAATGKMGERMIESGHRLKVEESSMIGWCIQNKQARIALDVGEDAVRFANPLLPLTRSEIALPLVALGEIIGAMTIQSEKPSAFSRVDITALQSMADQVANAIENARLFTDRVILNKELEAQNAELERFTYTVSHDLRAPLVTIRGFLGYLKQDAESGDLKRFDSDLTRIGRAVDKMQSLLNELLELSRIGRIVNPPVDVSFKEIVRETLDLLSGPLEAGNIRVDVIGDFPIVHVDRLRLAEVIQNLINNSIKFMGDQTRPTITISVNGVDIDGKPIFVVRDNGMGIEPQYHERIFGLFNRLDPNIEGTGIGLTLVKRIIDIHGGRIWVESELGKGAAFLFTLPTPEEDV
ncbi:MAG: PAS domain-containing protein [Anaerolineales bacterium]|nr:PAS domain-containing protein [Anaerolineales bacterium]